jgi:FAD/FMN-containing dehydrogenase
VPSLEAAVALLGLAQQHLGAGLTGFEVMGQFALSAWWTAISRSCGCRCGRRHPYCVLLENSDSESEAHARSAVRTLLEASAMEHRPGDRRRGGREPPQARQLWHIRESIPLAQAEEGLNIKHDISMPVSSIPAFCAETDALLQREIPGVRLVNFGHLGDGNLHYNVQGADGQPSSRYEG